MAEQLALFDTAHIGTLHGFCLKLVREHFYELGLDPQLAVLDEGEARLLADETLDETVAGAIRRPGRICRVGSKSDSNLRRRRATKKSARWFCACTITRRRGPTPTAGSRGQIEKFFAAEPADWRKWLLDAIRRLARRMAAGSGKSAEPTTRKAAELPGHPRGNACRSKSFRAGEACSPEVLEQIIAADGNWPAKRKRILRKPLEDLFAEAEFLLSLARGQKWQ